MPFVMSALRGWSFGQASRRNFALAPGETKEVCRVNKSGWITEGCFVFSHPGVRVRIETSAPDGSTSALEFSPDSLYEEALLTPTPKGVWCSRYDDVNKVYVVELKPTSPLYSVDTMAVYLIAPPEPAQVMRAEVSYVSIVVPADFLESLGSLLGSTAIGGYLAIIASYLDAAVKHLQALTGKVIPREKVPLEEVAPREILEGGLIYQQKGRREK
jgi:hypothetical protein